MQHFHSGTFSACLANYPTISGMEANNGISPPNQQFSSSSQPFSLTNHFSACLLPQEEKLPDEQVALNIDWVSFLCGDTLYAQCGGQTVAACGDTSCGSDHRGGGETVSVGGVTRRSVGRGPRGKKVVPPRFAFHTRSDEDVLNDGFKWRKYGQKAVKNNIHPRSYYRCTYHTCSVKKQIQRLSRDRSIVVTTYEGIHNHPSEKLMETLAPLLKQLDFLSRF